MSTEIVVNIFRYTLNLCSIPVASGRESLVIKNHRYVVTPNIYIKALVRFLYSPKSKEVLLSHIDRAEWKIQVFLGQSVSIRNVPDSRSDIRFSKRPDQISGLPISKAGYRYPPEYSIPYPVSGWILNSVSGMPDIRHVNLIIFFILAFDLLIPRPVT